jgi:2-polyprenyl-3-methyl-5-hydroxy-6-metoxy-1,4-benzoquinol methylase
MAIPIKNNHKKVFSKDYFEDYYLPMTGNFTLQDLERNKNWFYGWFNALQPIYDFTKGRAGSRGKKKKILEIGCAIGGAAAILHERGFDVTATDISPFAVKKAKKILPEITFDVLDIETLPKKFINKFDVVFSFEVIEHLENPEKALLNMKAMLKKGGMVINSTPYPYAYVFF